MREHNSDLEKGQCDNPLLSNEPHSTADSLTTYKMGTRTQRNHTDYYPLEKLE